jgi:outer membrane protein assembly factor BamB
LPARGTPIIDQEDKIYVGLDSVAPALIALTRDGGVAWGYYANVDPSGVNTTPTLALNGTIYAGCGYDLCALEPTTGTLRARFSLDAGAGDLVHTPLVASDGTVYVATQQSGKLFALRYSGPPYAFTNVWRASFLMVPSSPALGADGTLYVASQDSLLAFHPDGGVAWTYPLVAGTAGAVTVGPTGVTYVGSAGELHAVEADGGLRWKRTLGFDPSGTAVGPDGTVYVGTSEGRVHALSRGGDELWSVSASSTAIPPPTVGADGTAYVSTQEGTVVAIGVDGGVRWTRLLGGGALSSGALGTEGRLYVVNMAGVVFALGP